MPATVSRRPISSRERTPASPANTRQGPPTRSRDRSRRLSGADNERTPKSQVKACTACRVRKVRCDALRPRCSTCTSQGRECTYRFEVPRKRPTFSQIVELQRGQKALKQFIVTLKQSTPEVRERMLAAAVDDALNVQVPEPMHNSDADGEDDDDVGPSGDGRRPTRDPSVRLGGSRRSTQLPKTPILSSEDELDVNLFISVDDNGNPRSFGPSSALHFPTKSDATTSPGVARQQQAQSQDHRILARRNNLIANAAVQRHLEAGLRQLPTIRGVPTDLALHLLNLHWARQHHTFLLTYRPAIMRDLREGNTYCSDFMFYSILACSCKFSQAPEVWDDLNDKSSKGRYFFRRCEEILFQERLLVKPHITTVIGLLLLGSTYITRGDTSKGWLYTGYALRMVYDLGLHLDPQHITDDAEEIEVRRRVFWGAFACDKLQSLYLGRPVAINIRDCQVSHEFYDLYEDTEPFVQPTVVSGGTAGPGAHTAPPLGPTPTPSDSMPTHSIATFHQLCLLSKIMTTIISRFYVVGATLSNAYSSLQQVDGALEKWRENLAPQLDFQPWQTGPYATPALQPPNVMVLHNLYYSLIILLHRPFILDGHLRSATPPVKSWQRCTVAARNITSIAMSYVGAYGTSGAPYVLAYTIYVACTIHVRNAASQEQPGDHLSLLNSSLTWLEEMRSVNWGVVKPANIIRRLIEVHKLDIQAEPLPVESTEQVDVNFDFDAVLNMFSANPYTDAELGFRSGRFDTDDNLLADPLFGLMNGIQDEF